MTTQSQSQPQSPSGPQPGRTPAAATTRTPYQKIYIDPEVVAQKPLISPFESAGLVDVMRRRYLLKLLVQKEIQARYQGSILGLLWSYVQPLVRFCMYFFVIGLIFGLHKNFPNFAIHMFSALVAVHFFTETFSSGTRSIVKNKALVKKMAMPREMFPVASVLVSAINTFPQVVILFIACLAVGWHPDPEAFVAGILGILIVAIMGTALALLFSAMNVFFRDFQNIVSTLQLFTHWVVPMIYPFAKLAQSSLGHGWFYYLYMCNPLTVAVLLVERCFWVPTTLGAPGFPTSASEVGYPIMPNHLMGIGIVMLVISCVSLVLCQIAFRRLEGRFAERL